MFCRNCGKEIKEGVAFCKYCGTKVLIQEQTPKSAQQPVQEQPQKSIQQPVQEQSPQSVEQPQGRKSFLPIIIVIIIAAAAVVCLFFIMPRVIPGVLPWDKAQSEVAENDADDALSDVESESDEESRADVEEVDPFEGLNVTFSGTSPNAYISWDYDGNLPFITKSSFTADKYNGLTNGDTVTISLNYSEDEAGQQWYSCSSTEKTYTCEVGESQTAPEDDEEFEEISSEDYILPQSDSSYLTKSDLRGMSKTEVRYALNELYARHGRMFDDEELQAYFDSKEWYSGDIEPDDFSESVFNKYETANKDFIVEYMEDKGWR